MRSGRLLFACLAIILVSVSVRAVEVRDRRHPRTLDPPVAWARSERIVPGDGTPVAAAAQRFIDRREGEWRFDVDPRTGLATLVQGSGIALVPGRGNPLGPAGLAGLTLVDGEVNVDTLEPLARAFIQANAALIAPRNGRLELDRATSGSRHGGRLHSLYFEWFVGDVPVENARVFVRLNSGNITQFGAPLVGLAEIDPSPAFDGPVAKRTLLAWTGDMEAARLQGDPRLLIQPEGDTDTLSYRLVWVVSYTLAGKIETWEGRVDAHTGEVVGFRDINKYGRTEGGVYPRTVTDTEIRVPMPFVTVTGDSTVASDTVGKFVYPGGQFWSGLDGPFFTTNCEACTNPSRASTSIDVGSGRFDFGFGGLDQVGNGVSTRAARNAFYHLSQARRIGKKWLTVGWLDSNIGVNVNIQDTCNAVWTGEVNFFRSGEGCNNTGEISDIVYHEWGHGLDENTRDGDGATGEATADLVSAHITHSSLIGPYFRTSGEPVRDINQFTTSKGLLTTGNIASLCPIIGLIGPLGFEVHCEGEIYGQAAWDLSQALVATHGHHTGWRTSERIFFTALPDSGSYLPGGSFPVYNAYVNADDDDGNLANGTPNGVAIFNAFDAHGIAGSAVGASTACTRPTQPALVATPGCSSVDLSWTAVAGVSSYSTFRSELLEDRGHHHVADVTPAETTYSDMEVAPGVDYYYVVMSVASDGCESTVENPVQASLASQPVLTAAATVSTDEPQGNRSGFADPGEVVDIVMTLENIGTLDSTPVAGTLLSTTPGVTILDGSDSWPAITVGGQADNSGVLRFETDDQTLECGDTIRFQLSPSDSSLCLSESSFMDISLGGRVVTVQNDFETNQGWSHDAVNSTATSGTWTLGDPEGTTFQPEDDVSDPGTQAWFTAPNPGGLETDDVDNGVVILLSPNFDLSGQTKAILSYYRWFGNRDLGEDAGDFFAADVNDGSGWVNLETLDTNQSAANWTRREFALHDIITLTSTVQIRFQAADGSATGNLIEAAVDEIRIDEPVCDSTPACFTEPTFDGLQTAVSGSSCAEVDLAWQAATSNCINATVSYNVYRSTTPGFTPGPGNLAVSGLTTTLFNDHQLVPGTIYHYIVRAFDTRSGEDPNTIQLSALSPATPDIAAPVFSGLETLVTGGECGETVLGWSSAQESCSGPATFQVYRSTNPGFIPGPTTLIGSTLSLGFVDAALTPGISVTYVVRALDEKGNEDANDVRMSVGSGTIDLTLTTVDFESNDGGWQVIAPNDATTGNWEWGDPEGDASNPEDDNTPPPGVNAWITGLSATVAGGGNNDVDGGTTTLLSAAYNLSSAVNPEVRYARWFNNDQGQPSSDTFDIEVNNGTGGWKFLEQVASGPLAWVDVAIALNGIATPSSQMTFRFTARDLGIFGSVVEAGVDDFVLIDLGQGCIGCPLPVQIVGTISLDRSGDDVVLDWTADPVSATRYIVHKLGGPTLGEAIAIGTTDTKSFVHEGASLAGENFFYRVTAVDSCANESAL
jgi:hypothetical protein